MATAFQKSAFQSTALAFQIVSGAAKDTHDGGYDIEDVTEARRRREDELDEFKSARMRLHGTIEAAFDQQFPMPAAEETRAIVAPYVLRYESGTRYIDWAALEADIGARRGLLALQERYRHEYEAILVRRALEEDDDDAIFIL